ncbi:MAG: hypothetical protein ABIH20_06450 [Candidatus Diapherotrites archaeon]
MLHGRPRDKIHQVHGQVIVEHHSFEPVIDELSQKLTNPKYFKSLPDIRNPPDSERPDSSVRLVQIGKKKYVIKNTYGAEEHGHDYHKLRRDILAHQKAVRSRKINPKNYKLGSIKVLGRIGNYLIMEHVENVKLDWETHQKVTEELRDNFLRLTQEDHNLQIPQVADILVSGKRENGKFIVYLPYDYH